MTERTVFLDDLVIAKDENGRTKFGVVQQVGGMEDSNTSDSDSDSDAPVPLERGLVRVAWCNENWKDVVQESLLEVVDRSCLPRDVVRTKDGKQLGTAISTRVTCDLVLPGTTKTLKGVDVSDLVQIEAFGELDIVAYGPWVGRVVMTFENLVLKFSQGARGRLDYNAVETDALLLDAYPDQSLDADDLLIYYPGQLLIGPGKAFKDIRWISGDQIKFRPRSPYKVLVEQVELCGVKLHWATRAFPEDEENDNESVRKTNSDGQPAKKTDSGSSVDPDPLERMEKSKENNPAEPPPEVLRNEQLKDLRRLDHFWQGHVWVGDLFRYQLDEKQAANLNRQVDKKKKKRTARKLAKRMELKLHQSTSAGSLELSRARKRKNSKKQHESSTQPLDNKSESSDVDDNDADYEDEDDGVGEYEDTGDGPSSSAGFGKTKSKGPDDAGEIEVVVNTESDMNIMSPAGRMPTICGTLSCRVGKFELDFAFLQEDLIRLTKRMFLCNIQNPECSRDTIEKIGTEFQSFMRLLLKKNRHLLGETSCGTIMAQCPAAIRTFVSKQSSLGDQEIFFEYTADGKNTSGVVDKDGNKTEIEYQDYDESQPGVPQNSGMPSQASRDLFEANDVVLTTAPPGRKQVGPNVKFCNGQWVTAKVCRTYTKVDIQWQNGSIEKDIESKILLPAHHVDDNDFCPGDFVTDKRTSDQANRYGVVLKVDSLNRMTKIQWIENGRPTGIEEVSSYEIADHEELQFRISDILVRIDNKYKSESEKELQLTDDQIIGELLQVTETGMLKVFWSNGTIGLAHPLDVLNSGNDDDSNSLFGSVDDDDDDDEASWATESSAGGFSNEPELIGDAEHLESVEERIDSLDPNHERGEGACRNGEGLDSGHESNVTELEIAYENAQNEALEIAREVTNSICDTVVNEINGSKEPALESNYQAFCGGDLEKDDNGMHTIFLREHYKAAELSGEQKVCGDIDAPNKNGDSATSSRNNHAQKSVGLEGVEIKDDCAVALSPGMISSSDDAAAIKDDVTAIISAETISSADGAAIHCSVSHSSFSIASSAPSAHHFASRPFDDASPKTFVKAVQRDLKLLRTSLPAGITVKTFEDRMDLLSVLIGGPTKTPYEDGVFSFDVYLPSGYPNTPPSVHYISFSPRLNPNLYETGRVCVSLLGTWSGKGSEKWTKDSTVLQVLLSIQGLILNSEPYYNEAGYEGHRGTAEGVQNSRCYNEMVTLRLVQHMTSLIQNPPEAFLDEVKVFCSDHIPALLTRVRSLLNQGDARKPDATGNTVDDPKGADNTGFPLLPLSRGVVLSLQSRLIELEVVAKAAGYL